MFEGCCIKVFSRKQECPALSSAEAELCAMTENSKELVSLGMLLESILDGIPLTILGTPQCTTGTYQLVLRNDATAAISISSMEGLLRRVRHIELRAKYIQMLVKKKRLLLEHIPGLQNPSDGLTKSFKTRDMLINLGKEVGLVPGLDTNGLSWIRTFQRRLQLLAEEGEMSSLLEGSVAPEFWNFPNELHDTSLFHWGTLLRNFCFSLVNQRHFAKVLNSIDVGIAGDRLESSLLLLKVFVPSYSFHFVLFFCCESADVDLEYFCCPVWMVCWSFSVFRDGVLSFSVSVLWSVFVMCDWWTLLDDVD